MQNYRANKSHPNRAHVTLATFTVPSFRQGLGLPQGSTFSHITQNVDGLNWRAIQALPQSAQAEINAAPVPPVVEMHGRINDVLCTSPRCGNNQWNSASPICPALGGTESGDLEKIIPAQDLPRCLKCGSLARPGVVWFGEMPYHLNMIDRIVQSADLCLVVGTSSQVR